MAVREILIIPDKRLRLKSEAVKAVDKPLRALIDVGNAKVVSDYVKPLAEAGAHPLQALMALHVIFSMNHKVKKPQPASERKN